MCTASESFTHLREVLHSFGKLYVSPESCTKTSGSCIQLREVVPSFGKLYRASICCTQLWEAVHSFAKFTKAVYSLPKLCTIYGFLTLCTACRNYVQLEEYMYICRNCTQLECGRRFWRLKAALGGILQGVRINVPLWSQKIAGFYLKSRY